jgi:hypothetical protein
MFEAEEVVHDELLGTAAGFLMPITMIFFASDNSEPT